MRLALISDLHANLVAFEAVRADAARHGVDGFACLGDVATLGPHPAEIIAALRALGGPCILGNHDEFLLDPELIRTYRESAPIADSVDWGREQLSAADLDFVRTFVRTLEVPLENGTLFLFHGTPRSHMEELLAETPPETVDEMLGGRTATVMACGHTHIQMLRQHRGILIVNPGSLGMPFREFVGGRAPTLMPHAEYAIVESDRTGVTVTLRRVALDLEALRDSVRGSALPLAPSMLAQYERAS